jgi:hypothetical protein
MKLGLLKSRNDKYLYDLSKKTQKFLDSVVNLTSKNGKKSLFFNYIYFYKLSCINEKNIFYKIISHKRTNR